MNNASNVLRRISPIIVVAAFLSCFHARAQRPQDNWYLESTWNKSGTGLSATNGGLYSPHGIAIGLDQRIYVGDEYYKLIQAYNPDGTYAFSITNGFGNGLSFSQPRGMCIDQAGNLYVADYGRSAVFVFTPSGGFIRTIGGAAGSSDGQLNGVMDVGVSRNNDVYVLETVNNRVSVFSQSGQFVRKWGSSGLLDGQLSTPLSLAISPIGDVYIAQCPTTVGHQYVKVFSANGIFKTKWSYLDQKSYISNIYYFGPTTVRFDPSGLYYILQSYTFALGGAINPSTVDTTLRLYARGGFSDDMWSFGFPEASANTILWPAFAVGPDGSVVFCSHYYGQIRFYRRTFRDQWAPPRNAIPMPSVISMNQRTDSSLVDIDYQVTDADDTNVFAAALIFKSGAQSLGNCIRYVTWVEGTSTNLGPSTPANQPHRITWNAGADWGTSLADYRVAILAKDSRANLLDIHYLHLPAEKGMPALTISRSPLIQNDFMQVWWWLLATGDTGIALTTNGIIGVGGAYDTQILCDNSGTTSTNGRPYIYAKMNIREATSIEVQWAKEAATAGSVEQWTPSRSIGGRPAYVNEYGFDTGNWGVNAWWVVPQD